MIHPAVLADMIRQSRERKPATTADERPRDVTVPQPRRSADEAREMSKAS